MIEVEELRKEYGTVVAVDALTFRAEAGEIFGLLGPNGAGKSTTIGCLSGLLAPTAGRVRIDGHDVRREARAARTSLGVVPQEIALYEELTALENLRYWGGAYALSGTELARRAEEVLERVGLGDRADTRVEAMSGGMKRRLNFACGVLHHPRVLLLDEPTAGVDPQSRVRILDLVRGEAARGTCVLYTTHYMEEAEALCDRIAVVDHGRIVAEGTLEELRSRIGERDLLRLEGEFEPEAVERALTGLTDVELVECTTEELRLAAAEAARSLPELLRLLADAGASVRELVLTRPSLESLFIKLTGGELRE